MEILFLLVILFYAIASAVSKSNQKKKAEAKRREQAEKPMWTPEAETAKQAGAHRPGAPIVQPDPRFPDLSEPAVVKTQPTKKPGPLMPNTVTPGSQTHELEASFVSGHAHQETSMTGVMECPPSGETPLSALSLSAQGRTSGTPSVSLELSPDAMKAAILYSEILGKPKALRR